MIREIGETESPKSLNPGKAIAMAICTVIGHLLLPSAGALDA